MPEATMLLLLNLSATCFMAGVIWLVQVLTYPQFAAVPAGNFREYHAGHMRRIGWVVGPAMLVESLTAVALLVYRPAGAPAGALWAGATLVGVLWVSTATLQVPCHNRLVRGYDAGRQRWLVRTNWLRTIVWTARAGLMMWVVGGRMGG